MRIDRNVVGVPQRGLTLVELLVALVMGLVLLGGVVTVFMANKQTYRFQDALARLQENGRFSVVLLERDIRRAGSFACGNMTVDQLDVRNNLNQSWGYVWSFGDPVFGHDATSGGAWQPPLDTSSIVNNAVFTPKPKAGTDVLTLRAAWDSGIKVQKQPGGVPGGAALQVSPHADLCESDVLLVTDCISNGTIFQVSQLQTSSGNHSNVIHNTGGGQEPPGNAIKGFHVNYAGRGQIIRPATRVYFVADTTRGIPALYRAEFGGKRSSACTVTGRGTPGTWAGGEVSVLELVEGVEDLQVLYGVDLDGDGAVDADGFKTAAAVDSATPTQWDKVRAVRVALLLQSADPKALSALQTINMQDEDATSFDSGTQLTRFAPTIDSADRRWRQTYFANVTVRNRTP